MNWLGLPAEGYFQMDTRFGQRSIEIHLHRHLPHGKVVKRTLTTTVIPTPWEEV